MNTNKYDSFIPNEQTKKCFINNDKNKSEEIDIINCNEMNNSKYELFIIQIQITKKCALNNENTQCEEIDRTFREMEINNFRSFSPNKITKKC